MGNRPTGITILAILLVLGGLSSLGSIATYGTVGYVFVLVGILDIVIAWGLWTLKPWSRMAAVILQIIGLISSIGMVAWFMTIMPSVASLMIFTMLPAVVIGVIVIAYLMQPSIKAAFEGAADTDEW